MEGIESTYVTVVGGGPCGLVLAWELVHRGVPVVLLEQSLTTSDHPKTLTANARTMELWRRFGITNKLRTRGLPADYPTDIVYLTKLSGCGNPPTEATSSENQGVELARFPLEKADAWNTPEPQYQITQKEIEATFYEELSKLAPASLRFGHTMTSFSSPSSDPHTPIKVHYTNTQGDVCTLYTQYLVGCDGARSGVRKAIGLSFEGEVDTKEGAMLRGAMLAMQFRAPTLRNLCANLAWFHWIFNDEIRGAILALNATDLFIFHVRPPAEVIEGEGKEGGAKVTKELCTKLVRKAVGVEEDFPIEILKYELWTSGYAVTANKYQDETGRVFIAGDAAHLFTPTGAYGMNTGISDVSDLAWKFEAMYAKWGGEKLLSTYQIERRPISIQNAAIALAGARKISSLTPPPGIEKDFQMQREYMDKIKNSDPSVYKHSMQLGYIYNHSPIIIKNNNNKNNKENNEEECSVSENPVALPGARLPHFYVEGESIYDKLSTHFTLLKFDSNINKTIIENFTNTAKELNIPLKVVQVDVISTSIPFSSLVIVRPDQHIAWQGECVKSSEMKDLLLKVVGS